MTLKFAEAATIRARALSLFRNAKELLAEKTLPATVRKQIESVLQLFKKTWKDIEADAKADPEPKESAALRYGLPGVAFSEEVKALIGDLVSNQGPDNPILREAANMGHYLEAQLHSMFTRVADDMFGSGYLTREERLNLTDAIGVGLDAFNAHISENAPQLYTRRPWTEPEPAAAVVETAEAAAAELTGEFLPLLEKAVGADGVAPIKIIRPGWGSSGYYPAAVLERDGPRVFTKGLKMYWNHQTLTEEAERPEGDLRDLAAELVSDARWVPDHPAGAGLYAEATVFEPYRPAVDELAPHIGVSIRASGRAAQGTAEGRSGPILQAITAAKSVDFVTSPGAGGQILQLFEARRVHAPAPGSQATKEAEMTDEEKKKLEELKEANARLEKQVADYGTTVARLNEADLLREAGSVVAAELAKPAHVGLPRVTRQRLLGTLAGNPPMKDGKLDREALAARVVEAAKAETAYLAEVTGSGQIRGMGSSGDEPLTGEQATAQLQEAFAGMGLSDATAKAAARGH